MLIYAQPRPVSNGFRSFVPFIMAESPYETLDNMTSRNMNAWSTLRPVATSVSAAEHWQYGIDDIGNEESYVNNSNRDYYPGTFEAYPSSIQRGPVSNPGAIAGGPQHRRQMNSNQQEPESSYDLSQIKPSYIDTAASMISGLPQQWMVDNITPSSSSYSRGQFPSSMFSFSDQGTSESGNFMPPPSGPFQTSFHLSDSQFQNEQAENVRFESNPLYSTPFTTEPGNPDPKAVSFNSMDTKTHLADGGWWPDILLTSNSVDGFSSTLPFTSNSMKAERSNIWPATSELHMSWPQQAPHEGTISPQVLSLHTSSSISSPSPSSSPCRSLSVPKALDPHKTLLHSEGVQGRRYVEEEQQPSMRALRPRQKLPSEPLNSSQTAPPTSNDDRRRAEKKRSLADQKSLIHGFKQDAPSSSGKKKHQVGRSGRDYTDSPQTKISDGLHSLNKSTSKQRPLVPRIIEPKPMRGPASASGAIPSETQESTHCWDAKDDFLVNSKLSGMSYKEIRRVGGFIEAESTLRGRFRTLTKKKNERVRKPEWESNDIRLLEQAVRKLAKDIDSSPPKVPWKQVADYIFDHGGSYRFGNATCRKRWDELHPRSK